MSAVRRGAAPPGVGGPRRRAGRAPGGGGCGEPVRWGLPPDHPGGAMTRTNAHGQAIGHPVAGWTPPDPPQPVVLEGTYVRLEPLAADHAQPLFESLGGDENADLWTYRLDLDPPDTVEETARLVAHGAADRDHLTFAVVPLAEGVARGLTSLYRIDPPNGSIEVGGDRLRPVVAADPGQHRGDVPARRGTCSTSSATAGSSGSSTPATSRPRPPPAGWASPTRAGTARRSSTRAATATPTGSRSSTPSGRRSGRGSRPGSTRPTSTTTAGSGPPCSAGRED